MNRVALVVTDRQILPPNKGNRIRIIGLIRALRCLGWTVALISPETTAGEQLKREVDHLYPVRAAPFNGGDIGKFPVTVFQRTVDRVVSLLTPAVVVAEYAWMAPAFRRVPAHILRIVDCHDVLHQRTARFRAAKLDPWVYCTRTQERDRLACADILLTTQSRDRDLLKELVPHKRVVNLLPYIELPADMNASPSDAMTVLGVGARHAGNDGIGRFAEEAWPAIARSCDGARLRIIGAIGDEQHPTTQLDWVGEVDDLGPYYRSAAVVVCPVTVGSGVKIKMLEALRFGKAVAATPVAEEGLPIAARAAWMTAHSFAQLADMVRALLIDITLRRTLERAAFSYADEHFSKRSFVDNLRGILLAR